MLDINTSQRKRKINNNSGPTNKNKKKLKLDNLKIKIKPEKKIKIAEQLVPCFVSDENDKENYSVSGTEHVEMEADAENEQMKVDVDTSKEQQMQDDADSCENEQLIDYADTSDVEYVPRNKKPKLNKKAKSTRKNDGCGSSITTQTRKKPHQMMKSAEKNDQNNENPIPPSSCLAG